MKTQNQKEIDFAEAEFKKLNEWTQISDYQNIHKLMDLVCSINRKNSLLVMETRWYGTQQEGVFYTSLTSNEEVMKFSKVLIEKSLGEWDWSPNEYLNTHYSLFSISKGIPSFEQTYTRLEIPGAWIVERWLKEEGKEGYFDTDEAEASKV